MPSVQGWSWWFMAKVGVTGLGEDNGGDE